LLDEPSSGLAQAEIEALAPLLLRLRAERGTTLVVIDHDRPLLRAVADRFAALDLGRVVVTGSAEVVLGDPAVAPTWPAVRTD
jgi:branched-chain amino acid transport system ATP-binding protein